MRITVEGNGPNNHGPSSSSSPIPKWMRDPEWILLHENRVHQLINA